MLVKLYVYNYEMPILTIVHENFMPWAFYAKQHMYNIYIYVSHTVYMQEQQVTCNENGAGSGIAVLASPASGMHVYGVTVYRDLLILVSVSVPLSIILVLLTNLKRI